MVAVEDTIMEWSRRMPWHYRTQRRKDPVSDNKKIKAVAWFNTLNNKT